jgi:hypothetical protein
VRLVLRLTLPDEPGALRGVAAALGGCAADIVSLEVVAREAGRAVDDLCLSSPVGPSHLRRALAAVPGVVVEAIRGIEEFRDVGAAVSLAAALVDAEDARTRLAVLLEGLPAALWATWAAAVTAEEVVEAGTPERPWPVGVGALRVLGAAGGAPDLDGLRSPWLPLEEARPLDLDEALAADDRDAARRSQLSLAAAPLGGPDAAVVVARVGGPRFRSGELHALGQLTRIADRAGTGVLTGPAGRAATAGRR